MFNIFRKTAPAEAACASCTLKKEWAACSNHLTSAAKAVAGEFSKRNILFDATDAKHPHIVATLLSGGGILDESKQPMRLAMPEEPTRTKFFAAIAQAQATLAKG